MSKRILLGTLSDIPDEGVRLFDAEGTAVLVARVGNDICAIASRCAHMGFPLKSGKVENGVITCPLHNSQYDLCSGENLDWVRGMAGVKLPDWSRRLLAMGKKPASVKSYHIVVEGQEGYVEL
jgi:nitrite reductase/ring-hydroxylating ferredoxin subunit